MPKEEEKPKESFTTLSRRKFLRDAGLIAGGAVGGSMAGVSPIAAGIPAWLSQPFPHNRIAV